MIHVVLSEDEVELALWQAAHCSFGGVSRVRSTDRSTTVHSDNVVGQLGQIALHKYWHGHLLWYGVGRHRQNQTPLQGDGGEDLLGTNVDVKTSVMRAGSDPTRYNLLVRPAERHDCWVYVLALIEPDWEDALPPTVLLAGWYNDEDLPKPEPLGPFRGACKVPVAKLHPLPPVQYHHQILIPSATEVECGSS